MEVSQPILTLTTVAAKERAWPTSVMLVDKWRPYVRRTALRYMIVGLKQNHTLQLWDLGLGRAVQELRFPQENESDAICSVLYHPSSGMIIVGHPTRNSIYLVHLSAPKYNLPAQSQSQYVQKIASNSSALPKPEATAIMSGIREYSFASKGQLRSVDILSTPNPPPEGEDREDRVMFELYVMHSKGVTCIAIKKEDFGWSKESRVMVPFNAEKEGIATIEAMRSLPAQPRSGSDGFSDAEQGKPVSPKPPTTQPLQVREIVRKGPRECETSFANSRT